MWSRLFLTLLMALAMALGPLAMPAADAAAATPAHHGAAAQQDHCDQPPQTEREGERPDDGCCVAGCMAVAPLPAGADGLAAPRPMRERSAGDRFRHGYLAEIATPPPRRA